MNAPIKPLYYDLPTTAFVTSLSVALLEKMSREGLFPKARLLSPRRVGYLAREVDEWCEARPVSDLPPPPNTGKRRKKSDATDDGHAGAAA